MSHLETPVQRRARQLRQLDESIADGTHPWVAYITKQIDKAGIREGRIRIEIDLAEVTRYHDLLVPILPPATYTELDRVCKHFRDTGHDCDMFRDGEKEPYDGFQDWDSGECDEFESTEDNDLRECEIIINLAYTAEEMAAGPLVSRKQQQVEEKKPEAKRANQSP